jgi:hypothetical protein
MCEEKRCSNGKQAEIVVAWRRVSDAKQNALDWLKSRALVEQPSPEACSSAEYDLFRRMKMAPMGYCGNMRASGITVPR